MTLSACEAIVQVIRFKYKRTFVEVIQVAKIFLKLKNEGI